MAYKVTPYFSFGPFAIDWRTVKEILRKAKASYTYATVDTDFHTNEYSPLSIWSLCAVSACMDISPLSMI